MSASEHLHPQQMQLFVDPVEHIESSLRGSTDHYPQQRSWDAMWDRKLTNSKLPKGAMTGGAGVHNSVRKKGVVQNWDVDRYGETQQTGAPVLLPSEDGVGFVQHEGHHRMAAAADIQRTTGRAQFVPVTYSRSTYKPNRDD